jgi:putative methanogenesis marker protein 8
MEMVGKTRVVVENGKVVEVGEPATEYCPIFEKVRGYTKLTAETARENAEFRIADFGLFTEDREIEMETFVGFGASETFQSALKRGLLDVAVIAGDGLGTVITANPNLVQGIGARISGLVETSPIPKLIKRVEEAGGVVLDPETAKLDMAAGVEKAIKLGYKKIGVSVATLDAAKKIREIEAKYPGVTVVEFGVHTTGMSAEDAEEFVKIVDMTTGCTSKWVRHYSAEQGPIVQSGTSVPIFAFTQIGKELLLERAKDVEQPLLLNTEQLPNLPEEKQPRPLV